jgi:hypothetical protein
MGSLGSNLNNFGHQVSKSLLDFSKEFVLSLLNALEKTVIDTADLLFNQSPGGSLMSCQVRSENRNLPLDVLERF